MNFKSTTEKHEKQVFFNFECVERILRVSCLELCDIIRSRLHPLNEMNCKVKSLLTQARIAHAE
jgi:hypothetical protein